MTERLEWTGQCDYDPVVELPDGPEISCLEQMVGPDDQSKNLGRGGITYLKQPRFLPIGMATDAAGATRMFLGLERLEPVPSGQIVGKWWTEYSKAGRCHLCYILDLDLRRVIATMGAMLPSEIDPEAVHIGQEAFAHLITVSVAKPFIRRNHIRIQDLKDRFDLPCIPVDS